VNNNIEGKKLLLDDDKGDDGSDGVEKEAGTSILGFEKEDPFKEAGEDAADAIHLRLISRGRKKSTIIQGLTAGPRKNVNLKKVLAAVNKEFHCSGGVAEEPAYGGTVIKLTGDQREGLKNFLIKNNLATANNIKIHGV